ncbi:SpoIIE family protein phosphatase [Streptomyces oceani]|uniref:protein-serine/threonine phosphatase n=1 Tax=Streptomyces oceani TaxID=1075402 RepID=A0A1E7JJ34_9ACTN|nr:SpoIIE family protein phosphatase [Streptomyces oceani]OEU87666.1 protein phosphatase [Streptomyces oceani]
MAQTAGPGDGADRTPGAVAGAVVPPEDTPAGLMDTLRVGVVLMDTRGEVLLWSPFAEEILGWSAAELVGQQSTAWLYPTPAEDAADQAARVLTVLREEQQWRGTLLARHRNGHRVDLTGRAFLVSEGPAAPYVIVNLAESSRLFPISQELAALNALFESSPLGIALFDPQLRYVRLNEALADLNGVPLADHIGRTVRDTLPPRMAEDVLRVQEAVLSTGRPVIDMVTAAPNGVGARSVSYSRLADDTGEVIGLTCAVLDVTERREAAHKIEQARQRLALLDRIGVALGDLLDVSPIARSLAHALVPEFADFAGVMLIRALAQGGELPEGELADTTPLLMLGTAAAEHGPAVRQLLDTGEEVVLDAGYTFGRVLASGEPRLLTSRQQLASAIQQSDPRAQAILELGMHSAVIVPLRARGIVLGLLAIGRATGREPFDADDLVLATEIAERAGTSLDNARLYARERETALMLQRNLLPQQVPEPPGVAVAYRYVPGSSGTEAGGDWFDVIRLAGGRVAFVVGDVTGHGLRSAATMGRLRTAVRTLAALDLPPDDLLRHINDISDDLAEGTADPLMATCLYAVYDPSTRRCTLAKAGHLPPLLLEPDDTGGYHVQQVDLPSGAPLGVAELGFEARELEIVEGSVLVLYTDGLVEHRGEDITDGVERLGEQLTRELPTQETTEDALEDACEAVITTLGTPDPDYAADDAALLMAQLGVLPEDSAVSWTLEAGSYPVRRARVNVRDTLLDWQLESLVDETVLLVSELVTNSLRYAHGPVGVRMVRGSSLLVEVSDPLPDPPRARNATEDDEGGRGIQLVAREARRWGTRHGAMGKTVWFELPLPG